MPEAAVAASNLEIRFLEVPTSYAERQAVANRLTGLGYLATGADFAEYATLLISDEVYAEDPANLARAVAEAVGLDPNQTELLDGALSEVFREGSASVGVRVGPLVVLQGVYQEVLDSANS
ncbi:MAG: hypothetical protein FWG16_07835 [Micrococcales bacterium]|nr:hypothetical protein [Micrococcales bacterium]